MKIFNMVMVLLVTFLVTDIALAGYSGHVKVNRIRISTTATLFGTDPQPANTCSNWGEYFKFDHTTDAGKAFLSTLLTAKASGKDIEVWYSDSTASGTNQSNGCYGGTLSTVEGLSIP